jgi:hypothetical protein
MVNDKWLSVNDLTFIAAIGIPPNKRKAAHNMRKLVRQFAGMPTAAT